MATILAENAKQYRQALDVYVSIEPELSDGNTLASWSANNSLMYDGGTYNSKAGVLDRGNVVTLMDLSGEGFINDGTAQPIDTAADGNKYGILPIIADVDGNYTTPIVVTFTTSQTITADTQLVYFVNGERLTVPATAGTTSVTVTIDSADEPYGRTIITRAKLGDVYEFTKSNILGLDVTLRGDTGYLNPQLPISSLQLTCYIPSDGVASLTTFDTDTPVYYSAGYAGDMSPERTFYVSERITYEGKAYQVQAEDATKWLDSEAYYTNTQAGAQTEAYEAAALMVKGIIQKKVADKANVTYNNLPSPRGNFWFFQGQENARNIIARYMALLRLSDGKTLTYVDAGIPTLHTQKITTTWTIDATQITQPRESWDEQVTAIGFNVSTPYKGDEQEVYTLEGTNLDYVEYVEMGAPFVGLRHTFTPKRTGDGVSIYRSTMYNFVTHFKSTGGQGTAKYYGTPILQKKTPIGAYAKGDPVYVNAAGTEYYGDYEGATVNWGSWTSGNNLTDSNVPIYNAGARAMLARSRRLISFKWRGHPSMQPWDKITLGGTTYTLETISHTFKGGGFTSEITAREGSI